METPKAIDFLNAFARMAIRFEDFQVYVVVTPERDSVFARCLAARYDGSPQGSLDCRG